MASPPLVIILHTVRVEAESGKLEAQFRFMCQSRCTAASFRLAVPPRFTDFVRNDGIVKLR